jgi:hypothetical protein
MAGVHRWMAGDPGGRRAGRAVRVNGISADELMDCWEASGCGHDAAVLSRLWASVPPSMRLPRLSPGTVPDCYQGVSPGAARQSRWRTSARWLTEITAARGAGAPQSLMDLPERAWLREIPLAVRRRQGRLPAPSSVTRMRKVLLRFLWLLDLAYDTRPWWQRESWHPVEDRRIRLLQHEPLGRSAIHFHRITAGWLRSAAQCHGKVALETGALCWSRLSHRVFALSALDAFLAGRGISEPRLDADPARMRQLMQDFLGHVRASQRSRGPFRGQQVSAGTPGRCWSMPSSSTCSCTTTRTRPRRPPASRDGVTWEPGTPAFTGPGSSPARAGETRAWTSSTTPPWRRSWQGSAC